MIFVFIVSALGSIFADNYLFPKLRATDFFMKYDFLKKANENVTIIQKTEQVTIKEEDSVSKIAFQAASSVVNIISVSKENKKNAPAENLTQSKSGTGVVMTSDGLAVTYRNAILEKEADYKIMAFDGSIYEAELRGVDDFTNLAYLKIKASNLPTISFANSDDFHPGKKLIAIGNSFAEYQNRFAAGLLSNINKTFNLSGKTLSSSEKLEGIFETDFMNSAEYLGGPVIDYNGELVGIMGSVVMDNETKYFQIPSNVIKNSFELAVRGETKNRPYFGAYYVPITKFYAAVNGLSRDRGALIYSSSGKQGLAIIANSPAEKAGLKLGDIIIAVNNQEVNLDNPFSNLLSRYKKGDKIELLIIREGKEIKTAVEL